MSTLNNLFNKVQNQNSKEEKVMNKMTVGELFNNMAAKKAAAEVAKVEAVKVALEKEEAAKKADVAAREAERAASREIVKAAVEASLTAKGKELMANQEIAAIKSAKLMAKIVEDNKKRLSVKGQTNIMNVVCYGYSNDPEVEVEPSNITYVQTMESVALRTMKKYVPLVDQVRFTGDKKTQTTRMFKNIQDDMLYLTIAAKDATTEKMGRVLVTSNEVYVDMHEDNKFVGIISGKEFKGDVFGTETIKIYAGLPYSPSQEKHATITCLKVFEGQFVDYTEDNIKSGEQVMLEIIDEASNGMLEILMKQGEVDFKTAVKSNARLSQIFAPSVDLGAVKGYVLILDKDMLTFVDGGALEDSDIIRGLLSGKEFFDNFKLSIDSLTGKVRQVRPLGVKGACLGSKAAAIQAVLDRFVVVELVRDEITADEQEQIELMFTKNASKSKYAPVTIKRLSDGSIVKRNDDGVYGAFTCSAELLKDINDSFDGNGRFIVENGNIRLAYAVKIVDKTGNKPAFISDLNGFKAAVNFTKPAHYVQLDESKGLSGTGRLSMQMSSTLLLAGQDGLDYVEGSVLGNIAGSFDRLMDTKDSTPTIEEFNKLFLIGQMQSTAKNFVLKHDAPAFRTMANHWVKGNISSIRKFNLFTDHSGFARLTTDWALLMAGVHILDETEAISADVDRAYEEIGSKMAKAVIAAQPKEETNRITKKMLAKAESIDAIAKVTTDEETLRLAAEYIAFKKAPHTVIIFRSPKMGFAEFARFNCLTKKQIIARIKERVSNKRLQDILIDMYTSLKPGTFMLPAFEKFKDLLGGADFDFDGVTVVCDQKFIYAMRNITPEIVSVIKESGKGGDNKYTVGTFDTAFKMFMKQIFSGNMTIGEITNMNQLVQLLLFVDDKIVTKLFRKHFKADNVKAQKKYETPFVPVDGVTYVTEAVTEQVVDRIKNATLSSHEELVAVIFDLNRVLRGYQERTIDASKTADVINVLFNLSADVSLLALRDEAEVRIDWMNKTVVNTVNRKDTNITKFTKGKRKGEEFFTINDEFHKIMVKAYDLLAEKASKLMDHVATITLTGEQLEYLSSVHAKFEKFDDSLVDIKKRYDEANGIRMSKVEALKDKEGRISKLQRKVMLPDISAEYNMTIDGLTKMTRSLLAEVPATERAALLKYTAIHSINKETGKVELIADGGSSICHTLLSEEYLLLVLKLDVEAARFARSKVYGAGRYNEGDMATVVNGISVEDNTNVPSFIGHKDLNGTYMIEKDVDGASYLVADIEGLINIEMPEKKTVVVKLTPKVGGQYKRLISTLDEEVASGMRLSMWSKKRSGSYDKVEIIRDGIIKPLCKFVAPRGESPLGKMMDGFVGNIISINYNKTVFKNEYDESRSYYTILVVAEENTELKYERVNPLTATSTANPFDVFKNAGAQTPASTPKSVKDLFSSFTGTPVVEEKKVVVEEDPSNTIYTEFGGEDNSDAFNFFKNLK